MKSGHRSHLYCTLDPHLVLIRIPEEEIVVYDEKKGIAVFGGSEVFHSYKGYMAKAAVYRGKVVLPHQVSHCLFHSFDLDLHNTFAVLISAIKLWMVVTPLNSSFQCLL